MEINVYPRTVTSIVNKNHSGKTKIIGITMNINSKKDLENIIQYERKMWIARMYPQGTPSKVRSITLLYMKALRKVEYYGKLPKTAKICAGGGVHFLEIYVQDSWFNNKCIDSSVCIW